MLTETITTHHLILRSLVPDVRPTRNWGNQIVIEMARSMLKRKVLPNLFLVKGFDYS